MRQCPPAHRVTALILASAIALAVCGVVATTSAATEAFRLASSYTGTSHNVPYNLSGEVTLTNVVENPQGAFTALFTTYPPFAAYSSPATGMVSGNTITDISTAPVGNDCINGGCTDTTFTGTISAQGVITGTYVVHTNEGPPAEGTSEFFPDAPPEVFGPSGAVVAPPTKTCLSKRSFTIHIRQYKGITYKQVAATLNGKQIIVNRGKRASAAIDLKGLPKGTYTLKITVTTTAGQTLTGTRTYHTCAPKPLRSKAAPKL
jgi:hypothetical protein